MGLVDRIESIMDKWDLSSKYNTLDQDYQVEFIDGVKFYYKYSDKFTPKHVANNHLELCDERELMIELPKDENEEEENENEEPKQSKSFLLRN